MQRHFEDAEGGVVVDLDVGRLRAAQAVVAPAAGRDDELADAVVRIDGPRGVWGLNTS
jgi:hypothetical protein